MKRIAVYAHYDESGEVKPYVVLVLRELAATCEQVLFVSTATLPDGELDKLRGLVSTVKLKENIGLDFGMWQSALPGLDLSEADELLLLNSSIIGPVFPLAPILEEMARAPFDAWGMTESHSIKWHLQSYFLCFKKSVLVSGHLQRFFRSVLPYKDKQAIILSYELGLTAYLVDQGFRVGSVGALARMRVSKSVRDRLVNRRRDPTLFHPDILLANGMPFVKVSLFRDNPGRVPLEPVYDLMRRQSFDCAVVPVARAAREPGRLRRRVAGWFR
jgi:lipopolysaccharide biosynthesis protein